MIYGHGKIGRNVTVSHCYGQRFIANGSDPPEAVDFCFDAFGVYTEPRATRFARSIFKDRTIVINKVEHETEYLSMELSKYYQLAERSNNDY